MYGDFFPEPEPLLSKQPRLPGIDNRTMHTSYGNAIYLKDTPEETTRKVMQMYTDPTRLRATDPGHVEGNPVFTYLDIFDPDKTALEETKAAYRAGEIGDVAVKRHLASVLNEALADLRQRRQSLAARPQDILEILQIGTNRAQPTAQAVLEETMRRMGLTAGLDITQVDAQSTLKGAFC
jgi:tryptophanyl-tRNA synthetase